MVVSPDVIGVILGIMAASATIFGGVASLLRGQMKKIDERFDKLETKVDELAAGLVEVKVAVARLEGPQQRLQLLRT